MYVVTFSHLIYTKLSKAAIVRQWNNETAGFGAAGKISICLWFSVISRWGLLHLEFDIPEQNGRFCSSQQLLFLLTNEMTRNHISVQYF